MLNFGFKYPTKSSLSADNFATELRAVVDDWNLSADTVVVTSNNAMLVTSLEL